MVRVRLTLTLAFTLLLASTGVLAALPDGACDAANPCAASEPCCSSSGYCGKTSEFCLAGCNPNASFAPSSCRALPRCKDRRIDFTNNANPTVPIEQFTGDPKQAVMTLDSGVIHTAKSGLITTVTKSGEGAAGATISTSEYIMYGRVTATLRHENHAGIIGSFIFFSPTEDEIDFEFLRDDEKDVSLNMWWQGTSLHREKGNSETLPHSKLPKDFDTADWHAYTIDWNASRIKYLIDGKLYRTVHRKDFKDKKGYFQYPSTPMRVQISVWDATTTEASTVEWAGGAPDYSKANALGEFTTQTKSLKIECADPDDIGSGSAYAFGKSKDRTSGQLKVITTDRKTTI